MSAKVMGLVFDLRIPRDEKFILLAYADHAAHDGTSIFPAVATIAEKTGYSRRSVQVITHRLEKAGLLVRDGTGRHGTNQWHIPLVGGAISAPAQNLQAQKATRRGAKKRVEGAQPTAPNTSRGTVKEPSVRDRPKANEIPEVVLLRSVTNRYPVAAMFPIVVESIHRVGARLGREVTREDLLTFYQGWCRKGYNPNALTWLEWAESGTIPTNGTWKPGGQVKAGISSFLERHNGNSS